MKWSEKLIGRTLAMHVFNRKYLLVVPNCNWTGEECDLFCVTENLRIIDVEIKISRSDFKADLEKDKWYHSWDWRKDGPWNGQVDNSKRRVREWPKKVWKHYYAMPKEIWKPEFMSILPPKSGLILLTKTETGLIYASMRKRAVPNRTAKQITAEDAIDISRLATLRMWNAIEDVHILKTQLKEKENEEKRRAGLRDVQEGTSVTEQAGQAST